MSSIVIWYNYTFYRTLDFYQRNIPIILYSVVSPVPLLMSSNCWTRYIGFLYFIPDISLLYGRMRSGQWPQPPDMWRLESYYCDLGLLTHRHIFQLSSICYWLNSSLVTTLGWTGGLTILTMLITQLWKFFLLQPSDKVSLWK